MKDSEILKRLRILERKLRKRKHRQSSSSSSSSSDTSEGELLAATPAAAPPSPPPSPPPPPTPPSPRPRKRRRVIYSDSDDEPENVTNNAPKSTSATNDDVDISSILGDDPTVTQELGDDINVHLAVRWNNVFQKGLKKDNRTELMKKYLPPANCKYISPPILNDEIKAAVQENAVKRDVKLEQKQAQLGAGITCIGRAFDAALEILDKSLRDRIVRLIGDSGQILGDLHYLESITRRSLLMQGLNKETKEAIKDLKRDKLLFSEGLADKLKAVKACTKSAKDLKSKQPKPSTSSQKINAKSTNSGSYSTSEALNWRGPSRRASSGAPAARAYRQRRPAAPAPPPYPRRAPATPRHPAKQPDA